MMKVDSIKLVSHRPAHSVILADRHHRRNEAVRGLLETVFEVIVSVADEVSLVESACRLEPSLVLVDLSLSGKGIGWLRGLRTLCPNLRIIVLSVHDEPGLARAALLAGASGFVLERAIGLDLLPAIDAVLSGSRWPA